MNPKEVNKAIIKELRRIYGNKEKDNFQLEKISLDLFGKTIPATPWDEYAGARYSIINTDSSKQPGTHWLGIYKNKKNIYVYDSYGRLSKNIIKGFVKKMTGAGYTIKDSKHDIEQGNYQMDCGLRSLAWLCAVKQLGLKKALQI